MASMPVVVNANKVIDSHTHALYGERAGWQLHPYSRSRMGEILRLRRAHPREYGIWTGMKARCTNTRHTAWFRYGGRGVYVCARWRLSFEAFIADMGPAPSSEHSIDRVNNDGNYEPGNCRWASDTEQINNQRRHDQRGERLAEAYHYDNGEPLADDHATVIAYGRALMSSLLDMVDDDDDFCLAEEVA